MKLIDKLSDFYDKFTNADSDWKNRSYDFYLLFGDKDESQSPWLNQIGTQTLNLILKQY